ncbi:tetratricopeptide repeat protein [Patescibacteria group bacterium]|nr:tetratricopeptide repeat protein [Patescibacteria group bacterium]MBU0777290.1 tetratricopeptide repeat protein [Patescibacteria group bacterium]MBU0846281.1 tetratricopeptide repeat protein [Patescibacteria group bacterium]MBU0923184.1 tetratricopeptide repeat protein [Patescibacteria group bacterium]MBU1066898.1 tetratricopeptide repeat protein [Patescibacteria group bacterium]
MENTLEKIEKIILYATVFLTPLVVLSVFPNPLSAPKLIVLSFGVGLAILIKAIRVILKGSLDFSVGKFDISVLILLISYLASSILITPNKMEAFFIPGTTTVIIASALLYFLVSGLKDKEQKTLSLVVFLSGVTLSIISLLSFSKAFEYIPQLPAFMKDPLFNTLGRQLPSVIFLMAVLPLGIGLIVSQKEVAKKAFIALATVLLVLGIGISIYNLLPGKPAEPRLLDFDTSWAVAIDTLKKSPILGAGPGNYLTAFNQFKPLSYNQTDNWNLRFTSARNFYLTALTETGFSGAVALIFILLEVYRRLRKIFGKNKNELTNKTLIENTTLISLVILLVSFIFFAAVQSHIMLLFILLALSSQGRRIKLNLSAQETDENNILSSSLATRLPAFLVSVPVIVALIVFAVFSSRALAAEAKYKKGLDALVQNDGGTTYELLRQAINTNPYVDRYHASYSQINLALANTIAQNEDITDQDRETITRLIEQAIREAKATVTLNPQRAGNWEVLARTYQAIAPFAQGADQFTIQTFGQAVALDPINPDLRISLGGTFYALGDYDNAIDAFKLAVLAKSDHANAHYNLAFAYREKGEIEKAIQEMTIVLSLADKETNDYELAKTELESLEARRPAAETQGTDNLTPPQEAKPPVIEPPLELPEDAEPPVVPTTSPSPTPTPTAE